MPPRLSVIIVTYNSAGYISECLESVLAEKGIALEIFVVDNDSRDGTADLVREKFPSVEVIANRENLGFSKANNQGLRKATGEYVILLNPDTWVFPGTLPRMVEYLAAHPEAGAVGPRAYLDKEQSLEICTDKPPTPFMAALQYTLLGKIVPAFLYQRHIWEIDWQYYAGQEVADHTVKSVSRAGTYYRLKSRQEPVSVPGIGGAYFCLDRTLAEDLGWLDEAYFLGYEDSDWSHRIRKKGLEIHVLPDAPMVHYHGQSKKENLSHTDPVLHWKAGLLIFLRRNFPAWQVWLFRFLMGLTEFLRRARSHPPSKPSNEKPWEPRDVTLFWPGYPNADYLLEISNSANFIDKVAARTPFPRFVVSSDLLRRFFQGTFYWRVSLPDPENGRMIIDAGTFEGAPRRE